MLAVGLLERLSLVDVHLVYSVPIPPKPSHPLPPGTLVDHAGLTWSALAPVEHTAAGEPQLTSDR